MIEVQLHPGMLYVCIIICILLCLIIWRLVKLYNKLEEIRTVLVGFRNRLK